ncbi:MAG TPA: ATP-dependent 6-phosphofructokinase [Thermoanaerobaculia bacterium]|nr:ATP-dependent 6-phosphofructokinase [Thermoanaerobaculia bacterium]
MASRIRKIAISTGGGDAPGLNAVIRAATLSAINRGWECVGIRDGYNGLLLPDEFPEGGLVSLTRESVRGITPLGGTIIGTTNRGNPLKFPVEQNDGTIVETDVTDRLLQSFAENGIDALITIGGDGSLGIAAVLAGKGLRVIGVPKTIDNDLDGTVVTFGFDTAVSFATEAIDRLHSTADAHRRVMIVEVMGRYAGWIALNSGISASADAILIPEIPYELESIVGKIRQTEEKGQKHAIVVVAEGAKQKGGAIALKGERELGAAERLGGIGERLTAQIVERTGREARTVVLGHLLRGGTPSTFDRLLSLRFGAAAVRALDEGQSGVMVALAPPTVNYVPLEQATRRMKSVPLDCDTILTARDLGICFGD